MDRAKSHLLSTLLILGVVVTYFLFYKMFARPQSTLLSVGMEDVWSFDTDTPISTTPLLVNESVIVRTKDEIYSLNKTSGEIRWEVQSKAYNELIDDYTIERQFAGNTKYLIAGEASNSIGIYSMTSGAHEWKARAQLGFIRGLQIVNNLMIVVRHDENLTVYNLVTKEKVWATEVPSRTHLSIAANSRFAILAADNFLRVYDLETGKLLETTSFSNASTGELILDESTLYLAYAQERGNWSVTSLQLASLTENWTHHVGSLTYPRLFVADQQLYLYSKTLISLDKNTGTLLWKEDTQEFYSKPAVYGGYLYFTSKDGRNKNLCKADVETGKLASCTTIEKLKFLGSASHLVSPVISEDKIFVSYDAKIVAYRITE